MGVQGTGPEAPSLLPAAQHLMPTALFSASGWPGTLPLAAPMSWHTEAAVMATLPAVLTHCDRSLAKLQK